MRAATTFCVDLERFVNFEAGKRIYVQCALLYSDPATKRRLVRVHNVALRVVAKPSEHYKTVCVETAFSSLVRSALLASGLTRALYVHDELADPGRMPISGDALKKARDAADDVRRSVVRTSGPVRHGPPGQLISSRSAAFISSGCVQRIL